MASIQVRFRSARSAYRELQHCEILRPVTAFACEHLYEKPGTVARILAHRRPTEAAEGEMIPMNVDGIQKVAWLVPAGKREDLVDGEIDRVQLKAYIRVGDRR